MANNSSFSSNSIPSHIVILAESLPIIIFNVVIIFAFGYHHFLRQRNTCILLSAMAFDDFSVALGLCTKSAYSIYALFIGQLSVLRMDCFLKPFVLLTVWNSHFYGFMLFMVSLDRLLSICVPLQHGGWGKWYPSLLITVAHVPAVFGIAMLFLMTRRLDTTAISPLCRFQDIFPRQYFNMLLVQFVGFVLSNSLIYVVITIKLSKPNNQVAQHGQQLEQQSASQRKLTTTVGISSLFTFVLLFGPLVLFAVLRSYGQSDPVFTNTIRSSCLLFNSAVNFFLYTTRHKELRLGIKYLFNCKKLTEAAIANEQHKQNVMVMQQNNHVTNRNRALHPRQATIA